MDATPARATTGLALGALLLLGGVLGADVDLPAVEQIEGDPVVTVLAPDGIPSIDDPKFVRAAKDKFMHDEEAVLGVLHNGVAKAYSIWHLDRHEIVNDDFAGEPLAVTW